MFKVNWEKTSVTHQIEGRQVEGMLKTAYPSADIISYELLAGGCANLNYKFYIQSQDIPFLLRIYVRNKESAFIEQKIALSIKEKVPIPQIYYIGEFEGYFFAVTEFCEGISLRDLLLGQEPYDLKEIMHELGVILARISSYPSSQEGFLAQELNQKQGISDTETIRRFSLSCLEHPQVMTYLAAEKRDLIKGFLEHTPDFIDPVRSLVHADFDPSNILVVNQNGKWQVSAILDWEFAYIGSWMDDVAIMLRYAHKMPLDYQTSFLRGITDSGLKLPEHYQRVIHQYNLGAMLDGMTRHPLHLRPNIYQDICELIDYILEEMGKYIFASDDSDSNDVSVGRLL